MPGQIVNVGATIQCPHVGTVSIVSSNARVTLGGQPAAVVDDTFPIAGCPFTIGIKPSPCTELKWIQPALHVFIDKKPVIVSTSTGICLSPEKAPQGPPNVLVTQLSVKAS